MGTSGRLQKMPTSVMRYLLKNNSFKTLLDVGCGPKALCSVIAKETNGCEVVLVDLNPHSDVLDKVGEFYHKDFMDWDYWYKPFDHVFCSHSLEHQLNPQHFIDKLVKQTKEGGLLTIIVPPFDYTDGIIAGHVSVFTPENLLYRLVLAGIDCSEAEVFKFPGNIGVSLRKKTIQLTEVEKSCGKTHEELFQMRRYFPSDAVWETNPAFVMKIVNFVDMTGIKIGPWSIDESSYQGHYPGTEALS